MMVTGYDTSLRTHEPHSDSLKCKMRTNGRAIHRNQLQIYVARLISQNNGSVPID